MRFKLVCITITQVAIFDTFKPGRSVWFSDNDDQSIRNGIKHFYIQDTIDGNFEYPDEYVINMMDKLPKEDLSFKGVKEVE